MARKQRVEEEEAAIDMTPMLDIVFIMLIFFIVTTSFVKQAGVEVLKPAAKTAVREKSANIFVAVTEEGDVWLDRRKVDVDRVTINIERLLQEQPTDIVIVQADEEADHGVVVKVMDQIKAADIKRILISAQEG
jgi:biopolymer transport protein ExbD